MYMVHKWCLKLRKTNEMNLKERLLNSQLIYQGKVFNVKKDELEMFKGIKVIREVVDHPGAVAIIPILNCQTIIMVKQYRHPAGRMLLEIPAGTLKRGEKPLQCAKRELIEETGYQTSHFKKLLQCYLAPGYSNEVIHIFLATELSKVECKPDFDESINVVKVAIHRVLEMVNRKEIEDAKTIIALLFVILSAPQKKNY